MSWINVKTELPSDGQRIWYFSPICGLWRGVYRYSPTKFTVDDSGKQTVLPLKIQDLISPHVFESSGGCLDTDEVTHWQPDARPESQDAPLPPMYVVPGMETLRLYNLRPGYSFVPTLKGRIKDLLWHIRDIANENADLDADIDDQAPKDMNQWRGGVIVQLCESALQQIKTQQETEDT